MPSTLDISSKLAQELGHRQCTTELKPALKKHKQQKSCKLPLLKSTFSQ
jgi:hypothetical protein